MRVRLARRPLTKLLLCALSIVGTVVVYGAGPPGKPIQFGAPPEASGVSSNFNTLATKSDSLNPYSQAPLETPRNFSNRGSMEGVMVPPLRNQPARENKQSKRTKDLLEQRMNWAIMNNEELSSPEEDETIAKLRGSTMEEEQEAEDEALRLTPEERLFLSMYDRKKDGKDPLKKDERKGRDRADRVAENDSISDAMNEREESLRQFLNNDLRSRSEPDSPLFGQGQAARATSPGTDFFSLGQTSLPEQTSGQKARMDEFRQILGLPPASDPMKELFKPRMAPSFNSVQQDQPSAVPAALTATPAMGLRERTFGMVPSLTTPSSGNLSPAVPSLTPTLPQNNSAPAIPAPPSFMAPKRVF